MLLAAALLASCTSTPATCTSEDLAALERSYVAEALEACKAWRYDTCPELPAIRAKYNARRQAWVRCGGGSP